MVTFKPGDQVRFNEATVQMNPDLEGWVGEVAEGPDGEGEVQVRWSEPNPHADGGLYFEDPADLVLLGPEHHLNALVKEIDRELNEY